MTVKKPFELLWDKVSNWSKHGYTGIEYPLLQELLAFQRTQGFLRKAQIEAIEVYFYLRCVGETGLATTLLKSLYPSPNEFYRGLGLSLSEENLTNIPSNSTFNALRESLELSYPSYVFALTMGAGKTYLMGAIIAIEFVLSIKYGDRWLENALVYAPGTTIIESLKTIASMSIEDILSDPYCGHYLSNVKYYIWDSDKTPLPIQNSKYNIIVANSEKIRPINKTVKGFLGTTKNIEKELTFNSRIESISKLPKLGVFSDEAHHTYGSVESYKNMIREAIDYLHRQGNMQVVINMTGTPYDKKAILPDVVYWYGLSKAIDDNVLKSLTNNIVTYSQYHLEDIVSDFTKKYKNVYLPTGESAKIAFYFKSQEHLDQTRLELEKLLYKYGYPQNTILVNTVKSPDQEKEDFKRLNVKDSPHRFILLIGKGKEGWDCPSLFATAIMREVKSSNNYVLQSATRCLRQVQDNTIPASIYLHEANAVILDKELRQTEGLTLAELNGQESNKEEIKLVIRKVNIPSFVITRLRKVLVDASTELAPSVIMLELPSNQSELYKSTYNLDSKLGLKQTGTTRQVDQNHDFIHTLIVASDLATMYHLPILPIVNELQRLYPSKRVPSYAIEALGQQIEQQLKPYIEKIIEEKEAMALIKFKDEQGKPTFKEDLEGNWYTTIKISKEKKKLLVEPEEDVVFGHHYSPYNFDSNPESDFYKKLLLAINETPDGIQDVYYTGGITNRKHTDFFFEYLGEDNKFHDYYPDFFVMTKAGKGFVIEVKSKAEYTDTINGFNGAKRLALKQLEETNPNLLKYHMVFTASSIIPHDEMVKVNTELKSMSETSTND